jgi:protein-L-isoaspartate(D-aspartate) O-methyltransferase
VTSEDDFAVLRQLMVDGQLVGRGIADPQVLDAMRAVPRHRFVSRAERNFAYQDRPLPIGKNQTISQPYIVALMTELLQLEPEDRVLEVGTGSGYQAAILGKLTMEVHSIERHKTLAKRAQEILVDIGIENVHVHLGDGSLGWPEAAPYDAILATASAPRAPKPLLEQLKSNGRLVLPVGGPHQQVLQCWCKTAQGYEHDEVTPVAFVPLIGKYGWKDS